MFDTLDGDGCGFPADPPSPWREPTPGTPAWATALEASGEPVGTLLENPPDPVPVPWSANDVTAWRLGLALMEPAVTEVEAINRIRALEQLKAACAAAQVRETHALDTVRRAAERDRGIPEARRGRGLGGEIGLARSVSPHKGSKYLKMARSLAADLPHTLDALTQGTISEERARTVHRETAWLTTGADRAAVDAAVAERLPVLGPRQLGREVRQHSYHRDPEAAAAHWDRAVADRRVTVTPTEDGMAYLTAVLPMPQAAACHRALGQAAAAAVGCGEVTGRTSMQVVADTLVERLTGQASAEATPVELHLVMTDAALFGSDDTPAQVPGHGPMAARTARRLVGTTEADVFLRRVYTAPDTGQLVGMDSRRRTFPALLRRMVLLREDLCRTPYCDAQVKHIDHATAHAEGGATSWANASGLCARCNYAKENPGWVHTATQDHLTVTTPTGHEYEHRAAPLVPRPPGTPRQSDTALPARVSSPPGVPGSPNAAFGATSGDTMEPGMGAPGAAPHGTPAGDHNEGSRSSALGFGPLRLPLRHLVALRDAA